MKGWDGETVICVASGPSLVDEDCEIAQASGLRIIAVNNSWQRVPRCTAIFASDYAWWKRYAGEITIGAERWSTNRKAQIDYGTQLWPNNNGYNSGLAAIHLASWLGAARMILLGYDCQPTGGKLHWHGAHVRCVNPNELSFKIWKRQYERTPLALRQRVSNCSRETSIRVFPRLSLTEALSDYAASASSSLS